jgi:cytochrome c oxidase subunit III
MPSTRSELSPVADVVHHDHFESLERQAEASRVFLWAFLASEALLFTALFGLYAGYRTLHPAAFASGIHHNLKVVGTINTAVLLVSSYLVARAVLSLERGRTRAALLGTLGTVACGVLFLGLKAYEYHDHLTEGLYPGAARGLHEEGIDVFFALYYFLTGVHAVHVVVGVCVLSWLALRIGRREVGAHTAHPLELGALYWHLVDLIWIFLWPLFYLTGGHP